MLKIIFEIVLIVLWLKVTFMLKFVNKYLSEKTKILITNLYTKSTQQLCGYI